MINAYIVIAGMLILNAIFAAYEMAIASVSRVRLMTLANLKHKGAAEAIFMKERMEASLAVVQVGITFSAAVAAATGGASIADMIEPQLINAWDFNPILAKICSILFLVIPLSILTIIFAELIPKMVALNHRETVCLSLSPTMKSIFTFFYPLISVIEKMVKWVLGLIDRRVRAFNKAGDQTGIHELNAAIALARTSRLISPGEEKILLSASQLSQKSIQSIMTPLMEVTMLPDNATLTDALIQAHLDMHTRFPVYDTAFGEKEKILGYVNFKDIVTALKWNNNNPSIKGILRPMQSYEGGLVVSAVLENMIKERAHLAMVNDKAGLPIGMITLEDIVEELIGDIEDEYDRQPTYTHPYDQGWIIGGGVTMVLIAQKLGITESRKDLVETDLRLSDWCEQKIGKVKGGELIEDGELSVLVRKLRRHKVAEAIVSLKPGSHNSEK